MGNNEDPIHGEVLTENHFMYFATSFGRIGNSIFNCLSL